ncbi:hypothetical protein [Nocardia xishanensis]
MTTKMTRTLAMAVPAAAALTAAALTVTAAPAAAETSKFMTVYSMTNGPCLAQVDASVNGDAYPESAAFTVSSMMWGVGNCSLPVTLNWRNTDTGATGSVTRTATGPGYWMNDGKSAIFSPGVGNFTATITLGQAHLPEPGLVHFTIAKYQG